MLSSVSFISLLCDGVPVGSVTEDALVVDVLDAEPEAGWEGADEDVQVEEEGHPGGGLVLRDRRDDGDVDLRVAAEDRA